tara:strand:- start:1800 stop:2123 length:324 start_codon:yes stop_codon:yes gene_type:complete
MMAKTTESEMQKLREEFFDGPASDTMSFDEFLLRKGVNPKKAKFNVGGSISKSEEPGLTALAKEAPEVVRKMGKNPQRITKKDGGKIKGFKNGGCVIKKTNQKVFMG